METEHIVELAYSKYCSHYSKRNWMMNEPNYEQLSEKDKQFWRDFVNLIKHDFRIDFRVDNGHSKAI
jgi:hypothetical protein